MTCICLHTPRIIPGTGTVYFYPYHTVPGINTLPGRQSTCIMSPFKRFFIRRRWPMLFNAICDNDIYIFQYVLIKYTCIVFLFY